MADSFIDVRALDSVIETLIAVRDAIDADPDLEDGADDELTGDEKGDPSWPEWNTLHPSMKRGPMTPLPHEDAEEDDPGEEDDPAGMVDEDDCNTVTEREYFGLPIGTGAGCVLADPDKAVDDENCDDPYQDLEPEEDRGEDGS